LVVLKDTTIPVVNPRGDIIAGGLVVLKEITISVVNPRGDITSNDIIPRVNNLDGDII
jgi:hypothetical protein